MKKNKNKGFTPTPKILVRGFTLLELLIAVSIFAAAVVLVVGSFGVSTKNQRQVKANRNLSQNIRYASQEIARQIELSYNGIVRNVKGDLIKDGLNPVYNFAVTTSSGVEKTSPVAGTLFVRDTDNHCRYYTLIGSRLAVYIDENIGCGGQFSYDVKKPNFLTDEYTDIESLQFKGVMNQKANSDQAYVWITIKAKSSDSDFDLPLDIKTMATIRNYGREE